MISYYELYTPPGITESLEEHYRHHHHHYDHSLAHESKQRPAILGLVLGALLGFIAFATSFQMARCALMVRGWRRQRRLLATGGEDDGRRSMESA